VVTPAGTSSTAASTPAASAGGHGRGRRCWWMVFLQKILLVISFLVEPIERQGPLNRLACTFRKFSLLGCASKKSIFNAEF